MDVVTTSLEALMREYDVNYTIYNFVWFAFCLNMADYSLSL